MFVVVLLLSGCLMPLPERASRAAPRATSVSRLDKDDQGLQVWDQRTSPESLQGSGDIPFASSIAVFNDTPNAYRSVTFVVESRIEKTQEVIYSSPELTTTTFENLRIRHKGALLPYCKTYFPVSVKFLMPGRYWRQDTRFYVQIVGAERVKAVDLHKLPDAVVALRNWEDDEFIKAASADRGLVSAKFDWGQTMLHLALANDRLSLAKFLIEHGADLEAKSDTGRDALFYATSSNFREILDFVYAKGFKDINRQLSLSKETPLSFAIENNLYDSTLWLLDHGADPNIVPARGVSCLATAAAMGQDLAVEALIKHGADLKWTDPSGFGPMHYAVSSAKVCEVLVKHGVDVNVRSLVQKTTPIQLAARSCAAGGRWLYEHGADPTIRDATGQDAFDLAKQGNTLKTDRFFKENIGYKG